MPSNELERKRGEIVKDIREKMNEEKPEKSLKLSLNTLNYLIQNIYIFLESKPTKEERALLRYQLNELEKAKRHLIKVIQTLNELKNNKE